ncbi:hypothetical protein GDO81_006834 [Engystomops pustulosus]|uniref:Uncharacterized protein n=1 Tax=Engystomops pustulosus TaxID=76066 RepID=A0AAV7D1X4_ENGPU|nr:hypothetical protein GDO81_006834 [Engystomops pustulosus]
MSWRVQYVVHSKPLSVNIPEWDRDSKLKISVDHCHSLWVPLTVSIFKSLRRKEILKKIRFTHLFCIFLCVHGFSS